MRIAITADPLIPVPPQNYGGIERIIDFLVKGLIKQGHEVLLVAHHDSKIDAPLLSYKKNKNAFLSHVSNLQTIAKLKDFKPDIIHSFSRLAYLLPFMRSNVPKLMSYQREPTLSQIKKSVKLAKLNSLSFTGCSNYITNQIKPFAKAQTIYNGISLEIYKPKINIQVDSPLVFLGRIEPIKGTHIAIKVALETKRKLIIAGNIPTEYQGYFDKQIAPFLNEQINYIGPVNDTQKNEILRNANAFLMPILWNEPFGIVMAEAMACATPVIGFNRGSVPEVVLNGETGFTCNNIDEMINAVSKIDTIDRAKVREYCELNFSADLIVDNYTDLYKSLLKD
ncbi:MAG: glycosyltransferase family 4 protein [Pedobacter agri]